MAVPGSLANLPLEQGRVVRYGGDVARLRQEKSPNMRRVLLAGTGMAMAFAELLALSTGAQTPAQAQSTGEDWKATSNRINANAALHDLHKLAFNVSEYGRSAKDSDELGCREAYGDIEKAAHVALTDMHSMSVEPIDAIGSVSVLLRNEKLASQGCDAELVATGALFYPAGQAIAGLRWDYAIGDRDWYTINASDDVEAKNPLHYAQTLEDQSYSWVSVRPKGEGVIGVADWKAELASHEVDDASIADSGDNLKAVEVDYRKDSDDNNVTTYFYRTKEDALAAMQAAKQQADADAEADAEAKAFEAEWSQKLASLPSIIMNHDEGFKLVYAVCKPTGKNAKGENTCGDDDAHDWSDVHGVPYHWFRDMQSCEDASLKLRDKYPSDVKVIGDDSFGSYCTPASKVSGHVSKGYQMVFTLTVPGADVDDNVYSDLRENGSRTATVFKTFRACDDALNTAYPKTLKDLGADEDGNLLSDKTKSIDLTATCVKVY
jgi:hypothetical protein